MLALRHREKTGRGQVIDIGTYEAVFRQLDEIAPAYASWLMTLRSSWLMAIAERARAVPRCQDYGIEELYGA